MDFGQAISNINFLAVIVAAFSAFLSDGFGTDRFLAKNGWN